MLLVYYRDKDGAIFKHHAPPEGLAREQIQEVVLAYNKGNGKKKGYTAYVMELEDESLTAYLARKADERRKFNQEIVQEAINSIEEALDSVRSLEVWT